MILTARACERRRLKRFILGEMKLSPSLYARLKFEGSVTVNGAEVRDGNLLLAPGDEVALRLPESPAYTPVPCERKVPVLYEDEHLLIVNKPAPMACQSAPGRGDGLESCIYHYLGRPKDFVWRPVNRLDSGTGGLMVIARTPHAHALLQKALHTPAFTREYWALAPVPEPEAGVIDGPIARGEGLRRVVAPPWQARPHPLSNSGQRPGAGLDPFSAGDRPHPSDPGAHGPSGLPPRGRLALRL